MKDLIKYTLLGAFVAFNATCIVCNEFELLEKDKPVAAVERTAPQMLAVQSAIRVNAARSGNTIKFDLYPGRNIEGIINVAQQDTNGALRFGGTFAKGTFAFYVAQDGTTSGLVMFTATNQVYELMPTAPGHTAIFHRKLIDSVICNNHPGDLEAAGAVASGTVDTGTATTTPVPKLSSRPTATVHLYLDFDGEVVQDPLWNGGKTIDAKSPNFTTAQIMDVWSIVSERFSNFNINITTDVDLYNKTQPGARMRAIFTPTNAWRPGYGGISYVNSFRNAGGSVIAPNHPCWVFTNMLARIKSVGECAAHELAHTLGLTHDGVSGPTPNTYYAGFNGWAPVMGNPYGARVVQWSRGEYTNANNTQDDIAIIASNKGVGFAPTTSAPNAIITAGSFRIASVITNENDVKTYNIAALAPGTLTLSFEPAAWSSVDAQLTLVDATGAVVASGSQNLVQTATLAATVRRGNYRVIVAGTGDTTGYSAYGSVGRFMLTGSLR